MRQIVTERNYEKLKDKLPEIAEEDKKDNKGHIDKLLKIIPADIVGLWLAASGGIYAAKGEIDYEAWIWLVFGLFIIGTPIYLWYYSKVLEVTQLFVSSFAFVLWVFVVGQPFDQYFWYHSGLAGIVVGIFSLIFLPPLGWALGELLEIAGWKWVLPNPSGTIRKMKKKPAKSP